MTYWVMTTGDKIAYLYMLETWPIKRKSWQQQRITTTMIHMSISFFLRGYVTAYKKFIKEKEIIHLQDGDTDPPVLITTHPPHSSEAYSPTRSFLLPAPLFLWARLQRFSSSWILATNSFFVNSSNQLIWVYLNTCYWWIVINYTVMFCGTQ
jgi:hypothetical protein